MEGIEERACCQIENGEGLQGFRAAGGKTLASLVDAVTLIGPDPRVHGSHDGHLLISCILFITVSNFL